MRLCRCRRLLRARPCVDGCAHAAVNILACLSARFRKLLCCLKCQTDEETCSHRQHDLQHSLRENKVGAVGINRRLNLAFMGLFRKALFHTADILCGIPQRIVLRADQQQLSPDVFNRNIFFRLDRMHRLGIIKQLAGVDHIAGALALGGDAVPIIGMLIAKRHIGQRLAR